MKNLVRALRDLSSEVRREEAAEAIEALQTENKELRAALEASNHERELLFVRAREECDRANSLEKSLSQLEGARKLCEENDYLHNVRQAQETELGILRAQLDIVRLIFGSRR